MTATAQKVASLERLLRAVMAQAQNAASGGGGGTAGTGGLGGFAIDADGHLILGYAGAAPDVTITPSGNLQLEI